MTDAADAMTAEAQALAGKLIRNVNSAPLELFVREPRYASHTASLSSGTAAQKLAASIDTVPPGKQACPYHFHHAQEEMFVVLEGQGTLRVAGQMLPLQTGDVVIIPPGPDYPHHILNTSEQPLRYLSISTREMPEICEYPDSNKYLATAAPENHTRFRALQRHGTSLDYWDGEA